MSNEERGWPVVAPFPIPLSAFGTFEFASPDARSKIVLIATITIVKFIHSKSCNRDAKLIFIYGLALTWCVCV